ncbi:MAG TPA: hypothetical protein VHH36_02240 [Candidatus Thermoplasmatota archaeon]|nr:hypothetical protein [Candidatus Thermoplasmatota archaeon]
MALAAFALIPLSLPPASSLAPCPNVLDAGTGENAGIQDPLGAADDRWWTAVRPNGGPVPAYSIDDSPAPYGVTFPWVKSFQANWLNPYGAGTGYNDPGAPTGDYVYRFDFHTLTAGAATVSLQFAVDNTVTILLDGNVIGGYGVSDATAFNQWHSAFWSGTLPAGSHTLDARVVNAGGYTGFSITGEIRTCPKSEYGSAPWDPDVGVVKVKAWRT